VTANEPYIELAERLNALAPGDHEKKTMFANSGAEAVENAVKIARKHTGRAGIVVFDHAFHGRTLMAMSLTAKVMPYKQGMGPFAPEVYRLPFPNAYRYGDGLSHERFVHRELERLEDAFVNTVPAERVCAIIVEVVQGEGGFVPIPPEYLRGLRRICDENGIVLILDEVQSGFCRTGRWAAYEHYGVTPDLSTWAKSMGSGLPISAVLGKQNLMDAPAPGQLGGTYGGNPVACAAALATIRVMEEQGLAERAAAIGARILERFRAIQARCPLVGDVRGLGAMCALELVHDGNPHHPATAVTKAILQGALARGLLLISAGAYSNVIRVLAPLVVRDDELERGLDILEDEVLRATRAVQPAGA
jgi:4-aminobutyrate aminotransferase/(S)-3-amino-2-methylpropionate transaminase